MSIFAQASLGDLRLGIERLTGVSLAGEPGSEYCQTDERASVGCPSWIGSSGRSTVWGNRPPLPMAGVSGGFLCLQSLCAEVWPISDSGGGA